MSVLAAAGTQRDQPTARKNTGQTKHESWSLPSLPRLLVHAIRGSLYRYLVWLFTGTAVPAAGNNEQRAEAADAGDRRER